MAKKTPEEYLSILKSIAENNWGRLLSTEWMGTRKKYQFAFASGNSFEMKYFNILNQWPKNEKKYLALDKKRDKTPADFMKIMRDIAKKNEGKLLSTKWEGTTKKYKFSFPSGTEFQILYRNLIRKWPNDESKYFKINESFTAKSKEDRLDELVSILKEYGYILISKEWKGRDHLMEVKLNDGKIIELTPRKILRKEFFNKRERGLVTEPIFKQAFEHLFQYQFPKNKKVLNTIINERKRTLELDGYCPELKLAFEYQGHSSHWDSTDKRYNIVHHLDMLKQEMCNKLGIILIQIPVIEETSDKWSADKIIKNLLPLIESGYSKANSKIPSINKSPFYIDFQKINHAKEMLEEMLERLNSIAVKNNGKLISKKWLGMNTQYTFEYSPGIIFKARPANLLKKGWPTDINKFIAYSNGHSKNKKTLIHELSKIAIKHDLKLMSKIWIGDHNQYKFKKKNEEIIELTAKNLKKRVLK